MASRFNVDILDQQFSHCATGLRNTMHALPVDLCNSFPVSGQQDHYESMA